MWSYAPRLSTGDLLEKEIFHTLHGCADRATLRTNEGFDFMQDRLGGWSAEVSAIASPFDYRSNVMLYLPSDMPPPDRGNYQQSVERAIVAGPKLPTAMRLYFHQLRPFEGNRRSHPRPSDQMGIGLLEHGLQLLRRLLKEFRSGGRFGAAGHEAHFGRVSTCPASS